MKLNVETQIHLNRFKPKPYQIPLFAAIENEGYRKVLAIWPRRAGKGLCAWNLMIRQAIKIPAIYFFCLPTFRQGKLTLWTSITNDGISFLDYVPKQIIESKNDTEMKLKLVNGSIIQVIGSDTYDTSLIGTNPRMIIFDEFSLSDPRAFQFARPILQANQGIVICLGTPRGKNHMFELYQIAQEHPDWYVSKLTLDDTQHISAHEIQKEIAAGEISQDLAEQEYWTNFNVGVEGTYYGRYIDALKLKGQIGIVEYENAFKVNTAWDLGLSDQTVIIFWQQIGQTIRIIDFYSNRDHGLEHYAKILQQKPYVYGKHIAPHDIAVREWAGGAITRIEKARQMGINFTIAPNLSVEDGIEAVRSLFSKLWIDQNKCAPLIKAIEAYRKEYDSKKKVYRETPLHDWSSDPCDALRMLAVALPKTRDGLTASDIDRMHNEAMYGKNTISQGFFRDDNILNNW